MRNIDIETSDGILDATRYEPGKSKAVAIKHFCLICMGGNPATGAGARDVRNCSSTHYPLWAIRPFQKIRNARVSAEI